MAKIKVHVLNFHSIWSHIELVLENMDVGCKLFLLPELPSYTDDYKYINNYIFSEKENVLYFINSSGQKEPIKLDKVDTFIEDLKALNPDAVSETGKKFSLSPSQIKRLITLNGGHDPDTHTYYKINRWEEPDWTGGWQKWNDENSAFHSIRYADSMFSFEIEADPMDIAREWNKYWQQTWDGASILGDNCAVAAQWFLHKYAGIPAPSLTNLSLNHLAFGLVWPSFIPCPVALPGRVFSNAQFYVEAKSDPYVQKCTRLYVAMNLALATLLLSASLYGALMLATTFLAKVLASVALIASTHHFFKTYNSVSAKYLGMEEVAKDEALGRQELGCAPV